MINLRLFVGIWSLLMTVGCTQPDQDTTATGGVNETLTSATGIAVEDIQPILDRARAAYKAAKEKDHAWIVTARLLVSANEALIAGDTETAMVDAKRALFTAQASVAQAEKEGNDWQTRVPR
ncbi:MAG: hypothetical protein IIB71_14660 [Proteobacteria bacterium]|nr:hypothetical protein [Pseudomonadota bacterium]